MTALGLFRRARITELRHGGETTRDLLVTIEEGPATTVGYGGGVEGKLRVVGPSEGGVVSERFEVAPRAFFQVGRRNVLGKNRSLNFYSSLSLHPPREDSTSITEYRVVGTFREPRVFDTSADAFVNATFEQQTRSSFNFSRRSLSADIARHLTRAISVTGTYQLAADARLRRTAEQRRPAAHRPAVSAVPAVVVLERGHPRHARRCGRSRPEARTRAPSASWPPVAIGSQIGFVKSFFTAQAFRVVPGTNRVVFAGNARLGLATGFPRDPVDDSERSSAYRFTACRKASASTPAATPPSAASRWIGSARPGETLDADLLPIGGNGLVIFNAELRAPVTRALGVVGFLDTGNVFVNATDINLAKLRSAVGGGVRYKSPFGPIRFDLGFKVNRYPGEGLTAWFVSFGQAF